MWRTTPPTHESRTVKQNNTFVGWFGDRGGEKGELIVFTYFRSYPVMLVYCSTIVKKNGAKCIFEQNDTRPIRIRIMANRSVRRGLPATVSDRYTYYV